MATKILQYLRKRNPFNSSFVTYEKHEDSPDKRQQINDKNEAKNNDSNQSNSFLDIKKKK